MERVAEENAADIRSAVSLEVVKAAMGDGSGNVGTKKQVTANSDSA